MATYGTIVRTGLVTVRRGSVVVTGEGTTWASGPLAAKAGDEFRLAGLSELVAQVVSDTEFRLEMPWAGDDQDEVAYLLRLNAPSRSTTAAMASSLAEANTSLQYISQYTLNLPCIAFDVNEPPDFPAPKDTYLIGEAPIGAWSSRQQELAMWTGSTWFIRPGQPCDSIISAATGDIRVMNEDGQWVPMGLSLDTGPDRVAVETMRAQVAADLAATRLARDEAQDSVRDLIVTYRIGAELFANLTPEDGTLGQVLNDGLATGIYVKKGGPGTGYWEWISAATIPGLGTRVARLELPVAGYEETPAGAPLVVFDDLEKKPLMDVDGAGEFFFLPRAALARLVAAKIPADAKIQAEEIEISATSIDDEHPIRSVVLDKRDSGGHRRRLAGVNREGEWSLLLDQESIENVSAGRAAQSPTIGRVDARTPNRNDDASRGYAEGDIWQFEKRIWQCSKSTNGAARWAQKPALPLAGAAVTSGLQAIYSLRREVPGYTGKACTIRRIRGGVTTDLDLYFLRSGRLDTSPVKNFSTYVNEDSQVVIDEIFLVAVYDQTGNHGPMVFQESYGGQTWQPPLLTPLDYFGSNPGIQFPQTFTGDDVTPRYTALVLPDTITSGTRSFSVVSLAQFIHIGQNSPIIQLTTSNPDNSPQLLFSENTSRLGLTIFSGNYARGFSNTHKPVCNRPGVFAMTSGATSKIYAEENYSQSFSALANTTFAGGCIGATTYPLDGAGKPGAAGSVTIGAIMIYDRQLSDVEVRAVQESLYAEWQIARQTRGGVHTILGDSIARASVKNFQGWFQQIGPLLKTQSRIYNCAFGGSTFGGSLPNIYLWQSCYDPNALFNIAHLCWGTNDIAQDLSFETILANALAMIAAVKAYHSWDVALWTVIPRKGFETGTRQAVCNQWNAYLRANWRAMGASNLYDIAADPVMGEPDWWTTMEGAFDSTHPPPAGHARYALVGAEGVNDWVQKNFEHY